MSQPLPFPAVSAPESLDLQKKHSSPTPLDRNCERPFQEVIGRGNGNRPTRSLSPGPGVVGDTARRSWVCEPVVQLKRLPGRFVQYRRHGGQDRDAEYGRPPNSPTPFTSHLTHSEVSPP